MKESKFLRVLDANFNRTMEGLRVAEDIARFVCDDKSLTKSFKSIRHDVFACAKVFKFAKLRLARNIEEDVGKSSTRRELKRKGTGDIFFANIQRSKESIRVLEEFGKLINPVAAKHFKAIRYRLYALEKKASSHF